MNNNKFQKGIAEIKDGIKNAAMTPAEKQKMFAHIMSTAKPAAPVAVPHSWNFYSAFVRPNRLAFTIAAGLCAVVISGGSIVSAAENSLPGDVLYSVKINITEPFADSLAPNTEALARLQTEKASRRMVEAETLATQDKLTPEAETQIKTLITEHTSEFTSTLNKIREDSSKNSTADNLGVAFQADLNAHAHVLDLIAQAKSNKASNNSIRVFAAAKKPETTPQVKMAMTMAAQTNIEISVQDSASSTEAVTIASVENNTENNADVSVSAVSISDVARASARKVGQDEKTNSREYRTTKKSVRSIIEKTESNLQNNATSSEALGTTTATTTSLHKEIINSTHSFLNRAKELLKNSDDENNSGDHDQAYSSLIDSEKFAKEADVFLNAGLRADKESNGNVSSLDSH